MTSRLTGRYKPILFLPVVLFFCGRSIMAFCCCVSCLSARLSCLFLLLVFCLFVVLGVGKISSVSLSFFFFGMGGVITCKDGNTLQQ